ncbi:MAG: porin family protein [Endomicrobia bacterium]|nr:porin family protein [Endomicrobiia bacterium]
MRKLLILSLCLIFAASAYAQPTADAVLKIGVAPSSQINNNPTGNNAQRYDADPGYSISPEVYLYFTDNLGIGLGFSQMFDRYIRDRGDLNSSNFYFAFRPKFKVLEKEYVYIIGQVGYGMMKHNFEANGGEVLDDGDGLYYGVGGGIDLHNFIVELLYTSNKAVFKSIDSDYEEEDEYTMMTINIGYRFSMPIAKKEKKEVKSGASEELKLQEYSEEE